MKQINVLGYSITIERVSRPLVGTLPTGKRARRKLAREVIARSWSVRYGNTKIQRVKAAREARPVVGLYQAKVWVELAFDDNGIGEII